MALRFCTGFDGPDPAHGFQSQYGGGVIVSGRNSNGLKVTSAPGYSRYDNIPTSTSRLIFGFAAQLYLGSDLNGINAGLFAVTGYISAIGDWGEYAHLNVRANDDGSLELRLGRINGTILANTPPDVVHTDGAGWNYIEADVTIDPTVGHVVIRVDGFEVINYTGDTQGSSLNTLIENIYFGGSRIGGYTIIDDFYACDTTGAVNNSFLGDIRVDVIHPTGNGSRSEFTGSDGDQVDNYALVDDLVLDTADFVTAAVVGDGDLYAFADLAGSRGVLAVQVQAYANKDVTGARAIEMLASDGTTTLVGAAKVLSTTWDTYQQPFDTAPDGAAWTVAKVNAAEFGVEINA